MPEHADAIRRGELAAPLLGFPEKDVFKCDSKSAKSVDAGQVDWTQLTPLCAKPASDDFKTSQ
jgi:hypothetical protein